MKKNLLLHVCVLSSLLVSSVYAQEVTSDVVIPASGTVIPALDVVIPASGTVIPALDVVIPAPNVVIPAKAGIQDQETSQVHLPESKDVYVEIIELEENVIEEQTREEIGAAQEVETFLLESDEDIFVDTVVVATTTATSSNSDFEISDIELLVDGEEINSVDILIRNGETILYQGAVNMDEGESIQVTDLEGDIHNIPSNSVLAVLLQADQISEEFDVNKLNYYDSFGAFYLKCITTLNNKTCNEWTSDNWRYVVNGFSPWTGIDSTILHGGESVGIYFGNPYQVVFDTNIYRVNMPIVARAQEYDYETNTWNPRTAVTLGITIPDPSNPWTPIELSTYPVGTQGEASFTIATSGVYSIGVKEDYYYPSYTITVATATATTTDDSSGGSGTKKSLFDVSKAIKFLKDIQAGDGSYGGAELYTDWVAVAFGAANENDSSLMSYLKTKSKVKNILTDNERRAMALLALGKNPYDFEGINYVDAIVKEFDGIQFGEKELINDDIFALIVLSKVGYTSTDIEIQKTIEFILKKQNSNGSFEGSVDLTAAGIQSLNQFKNSSGVPSAITKAKTYLKNEQQSDGGWGTVYSTAWAMQAMSSLSEDWEKNGNSPEEYLAKYQQEDGGVLVDSETLKNRIWATSYAIPAALEMSWDDILNSVSKPNNKKISVGGSNNTVVTATSTSTLEIAREIEEVEIMEDVATSTITSFVQKFTPQAPVILKKKEEIQEISIQTTQELPIKENQLASVGQIPWFKAWWMYVVGGVLALGFGFKFVPKKTFTK